MAIRRAQEGDIEGIDKLLYQVHDVHHQGRPDLFAGGIKKYTDDELKAIIQDENKPIFVYVENDQILAHCFTMKKQDNSVYSLYIDDLCVDEKARGKHIGKTLYEYVLKYAKEEGFYNVTLNVWACNPKALTFYQKMGLEVQKIGMEKIL